MSQGPSSSQFAGQSIKARIILLVGSILLLFSLITGYCIYSLFSLQQAGVYAKKSSGNLTLTEKNLEDLLAEARHNADQFIQQRNVESVLHFKSAAERLVELGGQLREFAASSNDNTAVLEADRILSLIRQYDADFQELVESREAKGLDASEGLLQQLESAAIRLEDLFSAEESKKLAGALRRIQAAQTEYFSANTSDAFQSLESAVHDLSPLILQSSVPDQQKQVLQKQIKNYATALNRHYAVTPATSDSSMSAVFASEQQRQAAVMVNTSQFLEKAINELSSAQRASQLDIIRRHEEKYLLRGEKEDADLVHATLDQLTQSIHDDSLSDEKKQAMLQAVRFYRDSFNGVFRQDKVISDRIVRVNHSFSELEYHLREAGIKTEPGTAVQSQLPVLPFRINVSIIAGAIITVCFFSLIAALRLADSIVSPILRLSNNVRRVYSEHAAPVDLFVDRKDELGLLAREVNNLLLDRKMSTDFPGPADLLTDQGEEKSWEGEKTGNEENIDRMPADQSRIPERINTLADRIGSLCASTAVAIANIIDRSGTFLQNIEAGDDSAAESSVTDRSTTEIADRINEIIRVTSDMAEETGILALNAAIKAERAGSHGREFTVVVDELDKLAKKAKEASGEISSSLHGLAPLFETGAASGKNLHPDPQSLFEEVRFITGALQEIGPKMQTIGNHVDALQKELAELDHADND
jgi:methyl-accepting chemotaxis protein